MITFNEAKQMLDQGIFPTIKSLENEITYIIGYDVENLTCYTYDDGTISATSANGELSYSNTGGGVLQ